ncbi:MAG: Uma2 family endonuclease [Dehalococcoidia bacterium]
MAAVARPWTSPESYLARERAAAFKSEYVDGCIVAMSGASRVHNLITTNLSREVSAQLKGRPCEVYAADMRVLVSAAGQYRYPDVVIVCGRPHFADAEFDTLTNPTVLIEVLSPSTEAADRGEKFAAYRRLDSLQAYVLVAQHELRAERYTRQGDGWLLTEYTEADDVVELAAVGCALALREVYDKVPWPVAGDRSHDDDAVEPGQA